MPTVRKESLTLSSFVPALPPCPHSALMTFVTHDAIGLNRVQTHSEQPHLQPCRQHTVGKTVSDMWEESDASKASRGILGSPNRFYLDCKWRVPCTYYRTADEAGPGLGRFIQLAMGGWVVRGDFYITLWNECSVCFQVSGRYGRI